MRKLLLPIIGLLSLSYSNAQTPTETFKYTSGVLTGENGAVGTGTANAIEDYSKTADNAIQLDGTEFIDYGNLSLNSANGLSFTFWLKPTAELSGAYAVFGKRNICTNTDMVESVLNGTNKTVSFSIRTASGLNMSVSTSYLEDVWQQITFTVNKTDGKVRAYRNGEFQAIATTGISP